MKIKKIIRETLDSDSDFDWIKDINAYGSNVYVGLEFKVPSSGSRYTITNIDAYDYITISWYNEDGSLEKKGGYSKENVMYYFDEGIWEPLGKKMNESEGDFDWVNDIPENYSVLNTAFYFVPEAEIHDRDYRDLVYYLKSLGFESKYDTPDELEEDTAVGGLFAYRGKDSKLYYVYTPNLDGEDYYMHIQGFADDESEGKSYEIKTVNAREFVKNII